MKTHPPDRRLDPPEPTDAELREEKLRAEFEREQERREELRIKAAESLSEAEKHLVRALGHEGAKRVLDDAWAYISESGRAA